MYEHGIYTVYPWIFLDIPSFLKPDFAAGLCCWSHSMRTRVCVCDQEYFIPRATMAIVPGEKAATKGSTLLPPTLNLPPLSLAAAVTAAAAVVSQAFFNFPSLVGRGPPVPEPKYQNPSENAA